MNESNVKFGTGITVWCIICIIAGIGTAFTNLISGLLPLVLVGLLNSGIYLWLLLKKKKMAFYVIIGIVVVIYLINVGVYKLSFIFSLVGFINPIITYAFLSKYWNQMD